MTSFLFIESSQLILGPAGNYVCTRLVILLDYRVVLLPDPDQTVT
jgi:hypothetical protein